MYRIIRTATVPESLYSLLNGQLRFLQQSYDVIGVSSQGKYLEETSKREGVHVIAVNMQRGISPIKDFVSLIQLFKVFKKEKPIIVHSMTPKAGLLSMLAAKMAGVPIRIHTFTGLIFPSKRGFKQKLLIFMDKLLCWSATEIFPEGNGVKNDLLKFKITKKPLNIIANGNVNGINLNHFDLSILDVVSLQNLKKKLKIDENDFVYIFVGRLVADKGINELVEAFKAINSQQNSKLILVGAYESHLDPLELDTLNEIKSNPNIIEVGFQSDVRPFFAISNIFVFPSYREGFPNTVLQAGAMELPCIVTNINGSNEIIENGKNGLVIKVKDVEDLKSAMNNVYQNPNLLLDLKKFARPMIKEKYSQELVWNSLLTVYSNLIQFMQK